ncbi:MAG: biotin--[acetyl-CoA-carboxylase] ligase [Pseudomonadota bacterium]
MNQPLPVIWHETIDSTNVHAKRLAQAGRFPEHWIAAHRQTAGRGRLGRSWESPTGNVYATALISVPGGVSDALRLPFAAALAVHDTIEAFAPDADLGLKWPNDVRCKGAKLSGILVESGSGDTGTWAAVGVGINVASAPKSVEQTATCLAEISDGPVPGADLVLEALVETFEQRKSQAWNDFARTRHDWSERAEGRNGLVKAVVGDRVFEGSFAGLANDGGLMLDLPCGTRETIRAGDVELVRRV